MAGRNIRSTTFGHMNGQIDKEQELLAIKEIDETINAESGGSEASGKEQCQNPEALKGQRFKKKHFILSLDGGGLHGVVSGTILYRVENILKGLLLERIYQKYGPGSPCRDAAKLKHYYLITMRDLRLSDVVDTIAGTSTGAIMAGYLAAQAARAGRFEADASYNTASLAIQKELHKPYNDGRAYKAGTSFNFSISGDKSVQNEMIKIFNKSFGSGRYKTSQIVELYSELSARAFVDNKTYPILGEKSSWLRKMMIKALLWFVPTMKILFRPKYQSSSMNEMLIDVYGEDLALSDIAHSSHWAGTLILTAFSVDRGAPVLIVAEGSYKESAENVISFQSPMQLPSKNFHGLLAVDPFQWTQLYTEPQSRNAHIASEDKDRDFPFGGKYSVGSSRSSTIMEADFPLWEAIRSSSAFPIYYAPHKLSVKPESDPNDGFLLADGGLFGNDPTIPAILYTLFTKEYFLSETPPKKPIDNLKNVVVLSIATGQLRGNKSAEAMNYKLDGRAGLGWWFTEAPGNLLTSLLGNMELVAEINTAQLFQNAGLLENYMRIKFSLDKDSETGKLFQETTFSLGSDPDKSMAAMIQIGHGVVDRYEGLVEDWRQNEREDEEHSSPNEPLITNFLRKNFFQDDSLLEFVEEKFPFKGEHTLFRSSTSI